MPSSATEPTRNLWDSVDDGLWADAAAAADAESAPTNSEKGSGHIYNTGWTSGRANYMWASVAEWFQRVRDSLLPQHQDNGSHYEVTVYGDAAATKFAVYGTNGETAATTKLLNLVDDEVSLTPVGYVYANGYAYMQRLYKLDTTEMQIVIPGNAGKPVTSGTWVPATTTPLGGFSDADGTSRTVLYHVPPPPAYATGVEYRVVAQLNDTGQTVSATAYYTGTGDDATGTAAGAITPITGSTGVLGAEVAFSAGGTNIGQNGFWILVTLNNNSVAYATVCKVIVRYTNSRIA